MLQELEATMNNLVDKARGQRYRGHATGLCRNLKLIWFSPMPSLLQEIQHAYHTNALLIKMLLSQAQANGVDLLVDTNALENEFLLKQVCRV